MTDRGEGGRIGTVYVILDNLQSPKQAVRKGTVIDLSNLFLLFEFFFYSAHTLLC